MCMRMPKDHPDTSQSSVESQRKYPNNPACTKSVRGLQNVEAESVRVFKMLNSRRRTRRKSQSLYNVDAGHYTVDEEQEESVRRFKMLKLDTIQKTSEEQEESVRVFKMLKLLPGIVTYKRRRNVPVFKMFKLDIVTSRREEEGGGGGGGGGRSESSKC